MPASEYSHAGAQAAAVAADTPRIAPTRAGGSPASGDAGPGETLVRDCAARRRRVQLMDLECDYADAFLALRPLGQAPPGPDDDPALGRWGFIAEEVARIDPCLVHFTYADEAFEEVEVDDGAGGTRRERALKPGARRTVPASVAYDRMTVLLHAVAKRQQAELETLEEELCALAARVEGLEEAC